MKQVDPKHKPQGHFLGFIPYYKKEPLTIGQAIGIAFTIAGIYLVNYFS